MRQYVAFDVSKQTSEAVIVDAAGTCLVRRQVKTDPLVMAAFVARLERADRFACGPRDDVGDGRHHAVIAACGRACLADEPRSVPATNRVGSRQAIR